MSPPLFYPSSGLEHSPGSVEAAVSRLSPAWLQMTVSQTLLDLYDDRLSTTGEKDASLTLQSIVSHEDIQSGTIIMRSPILCYYISQHSDRSRTYIRLYDCLISIIGFPILVRGHLYIESRSKKLDALCILQNSFHFCLLAFFHHIQSSAIVTRFNFSQYYIWHCDDSCRTEIRNWNSQHTPHISSSRASYGMSVVRILE